MKETKNIWVIAEVESGAITEITFELIGKARELAEICGESVEVLLIGDSVSTFTKELIAYGADTVHLAENAIFADQIDEHFATCAANIISAQRPNVLLVGATERGRSISARLAALLDTGLTADCTELSIEPTEKLLLQSRPAFGGNIMATIKTPNHRPQMASVRQGVMSKQPKDENRKGEVVTHDTTTLNFDNRVKVISHTLEKIATAQLCDSKIIVGVGRGVKSREQVAKIEEFASKIGATVAGSRAAVEAGLIDATLQVGQTGHTISPDLYIAIGISGQIQHTAAITGAKTIIAINPDPSAPIFNCADYGYISSIEDVLPQIISQMI